MAEMSAGLANCFCGQPREKPPLNPSAGQFAAFAGAVACCAKSTGPVNIAAANAAQIPNAFSCIVVCSPDRSLDRKRNYILSCIAAWPYAAPAIEEKEIAEALQGNLDRLNADQ